MRAHDELHRTRTLHAATVLAASGAPAFMRGKRHYADPFPALPDQAPIVGIEMGFKPPEDASEGSAQRGKRLPQRGPDQRLQEFIAHHQYRIGDIGRKPPPETLA